MTSELAARLLQWYAENARSLPWRGHPDPYAVLVSEFMLQQTQVDTVIPYFNAWMERFPDAASLAAAPVGDVLRQWEGLGYYSRARNLHAAAGQICARFGGQVPAEVSQLESLPGIGPYTARAVASIAFGADELALDGNIRRVLSRLADMALPARSKEGKAALTAFGRQHLPGGKAGDFNQALMDLGATLCTPRQPACGRCPLAEHCAAHALGVEEARPVLPPRKTVPHYIVTAAILQRDGLILLAQRKPDGLLGGMWEFPGGKQQPDETLADCLARELQEELGVEAAIGAPFGVYRHAYTHFKVTLHAFFCTLMQGEPQPLDAAQLRWVQPAELRDFAMGKIDRQIAENLLAQLKER
ncbi:MAG TPA: A/G-specific adenine glycosylase [Anaerolineaceae bacterium]|nr:A/G-specific adenine glycosylase [Anaerolineaceae bacterium]HPN52046.1 A/G-specific adenine glycosylase [Anaerolineaceae bacterium]